jgi:hypothetical protein
MSMLSSALQEGILTVSAALRGRPIDWLIGGSSGLLLQQVPTGKEPRDLDIYIDEEAAPAVFESLRELATDDLQYSETGIYRSLLSHYDAGGVTIEVVAGFRVNAKGSSYAVEASYLRRNHPVKREIAGTDLFLMPLSHELLFNVLRERPDRYETIAAAMREDLERHLPVLQDLLQRNRWSAAIRRTFGELLGVAL